MNQGSLLVAKGLTSTQIIQNKPKGYDKDETFNLPCFLRANHALPSSLLLPLPPDPV